jgi:uncharacterized protein (TIGR02246 family)
MEKFKGMLEWNRWSIGALSMCVVGALGFAACSSTPTTPTAAPAAVDTRAADEAAIRSADAAWTKAAESKDIAGTTAVYADNAVLMAPGGPIATGKDAITKGWTGMMADKNFALSFGPTKIEVAKSGDLAYELGDYSLTLSDKKGKAQTSKGKYVVVWGKQADGGWKALVDAPTTTTN